MESIELCNTCNTRHVIGNEEIKRKNHLYIKRVEFVQWAAMEFLEGYVIGGGKMFEIFSGIHNLFGI